MLEALSEPFPVEAVGTKPEIWCHPCRLGHCTEHEVKPCSACGATVTEAHDDIDYVGQAFVRERLNKVDPEWTWRPLAVDDRGLPLTDKDGGLWIELTVGGKPMLGYGDAPMQMGSRAVKEAISRAIRNAGQSFGIALQMWQQQRKRPLQLVPTEDEERRAKRLREEIAHHGRGKGKKFAAIVMGFNRWAEGRCEFASAPAGELARYLDHVKARSA
jgi:hypothetical protein